MPSGGVANWRAEEGNADTRGTKIMMLVPKRAVNCLVQKEEQKRNKIKRK
jgi:hypothetical protein